MERDEHLCAIGVSAVTVTPTETTVVSVDDANSRDGLLAREPEDLDGSTVELVAVADATVLAARPEFEIHRADVVGQLQFDDDVLVNEPDVAETSHERGVDRVHEVVGEALALVGHLELAAHDGRRDLLADPLGELLREQVVGGHGDSSEVVCRADPTRFFRTPDPVCACGE